MFSKVRKSKFVQCVLAFMLMTGMLGLQPTRPVFASTLVVTNTNDSGAGSLRQAIAGASSGETITFDLSLSGQTITLASTLTIDKNLTIDGSALAAKINVSGNDSVQVFSIVSGVTTLFDSLIIRNGYTIVQGGGIYNEGTLTISNSKLLDNSSAIYGGAIISRGTLIISDSTLSGNSAHDYAGVANWNGTLTITNSEISGNSATRDGGGIHNAGVLTVTNSTFSGNSASYGGGVYNEFGTMTITNSTFSGNSASLGGGIANYSDITLINTIVANSPIGGDCLNGNGTMIADTYNFDTDGSCDNAMQKSPLEINLASLADNGGSTQTFALLAGSHAIDSGNDANCPATDQRGVARPQGNSCDIGAFEYQDLMPTVTSITRAGTNPSSAASVDFTVTFSESVLDVDMGDLSLTTTGVMGASITNVSGSGATRMVTVNTGSGNGTIRLDVVDDDSILDVTNNPLGGAGLANGSFIDGETYSILKESSFGDVSTGHPYWQDIEILYANGYTGGCSTSPLLFCPDLTMNRAQSAVFMVRGNFGGGYVPVVPTHFFADNWSNVAWAEGWAESMFLTGLSGGCSVTPQLFCPEELFTNVQAAVFGLRMKYGVNYQPPAASGTVFADLSDVNFWGTPWAEKAYAEGLLPACGTSGGKPLFCPSNLVSRGFGASIIIKAKDLAIP